MKSKLATGELLAPIMTNTWGPRPGKVTKMTVHCVVGQLPAKRICEILNGKRASATYVIGVDGEIWCNVLEENAPGTSSSRWNDQQAITVECASDLNHPYAFNDKVWKSLVALAKDIEQRHGFKLAFTGNENGSLTYHRMFSNTACPGQWFIDNTARFIKEVHNESTQLPPTTNPKPSFDANALAKRIANGEFGNAPARWDNLAKAGFTQDQINQAQDIINKEAGTQLPPTTNPKPSFDANALAKRIANGEFGNEPQRTPNVLKAGFTKEQLNQAQTIINQGSVITNNSQPTFNAYDLAKKIANGDYGNEPQRTPNVLRAGFTKNQLQAAQNLINQGKV